MSKKGKQKTSDFVFKRHDNVGSLAAEDDLSYLLDCFVDPGDLSTLKNCDNNKCILRGRTGSGKTALIEMIRANEEHIIDLDPYDLSLNYLSNSDIIQFLKELGVKLDLFYKLLWEHVIATELIRLKFDIRNNDKLTKFNDWILRTIGKDEKKKVAYEFLKEHGSQFWADTDQKVKEHLTRLERDVRGAAGVDFSKFKLNAEGARRLTEQQRTEYRSTITREIVDETHIRKLRRVIEILGQDIFDDRQQKYFILIDRLDEDWAVNEIRYNMLLVLFDAIREFQSIPGVKVVVALRTDLIDLLIKYARSKAGIQGEKYRSFYLDIRWRKEQIEEVLSRRVNKLIKDRYTTKKVSIKEILPPKMKNYNESGLDYILNRTMLRPREAIDFLNKCIQRAESQPAITATMIKNAEAEYSRDFLDSVSDEWKQEFPALYAYFNILRNRESPFQYKSIKDEELKAFISDYFQAPRYDKDQLLSAIQKYQTGEININSFFGELFRVLYRVGVIGVKLSTTNPTIWSYLDQPALSHGQIKPSTRIYVHPAFVSALAIRASG